MCACVGGEGRDLNALLERIAAHDDADRTLAA
jgi:hypothetical protein